MRATAVKAKAYEILFRAHPPVDEDEALEYQWISPEGREFWVRDLIDIYPDPRNRYFLYEVRIPNEPHLTGISDPAERARLQGRLRDAISALGPNEILANLPEGIRPENISRSGAGIGPRSVYYQTLGQAKSAIALAIKHNEWYCHTQAAPDEKQLALTARSEARASLRFWAQRLSALTGAGGSEPQMMRAMTGMDGSLSDETRHALLSFLNTPSVRSWDDLAHRGLLAGSQSAWKIWIENDPGAPRSLKAPGQWDTHPGPGALLEWVERERERMVALCEKKIDSAKHSLIGLGVINEYTNDPGPGQDPGQ